MRPGPMEWDYAERVADGHASVAEDAGAVVALLVLIPQTDHLVVENVAVDPTRQGEGIGRALLAFAEDIARSTARPELRLFTHAAMTENLAFYPKLGYRETERRSERGFSRVFFAKRVEP